MTVTAIVCKNKSGIIGDGNALCTKNFIADLSFFYYNVIGSTIIIGNKTFQGIKNFKKRNITDIAKKIYVISRTHYENYKNVEFISMEEIKELIVYNKSLNFLICGGKSIYEQLEEYIDVYLISEYNDLPIEINSPVTLELPELIKVKSLISGVSGEYTFEIAMYKKRKFMNMNF